MKADEISMPDLGDIVGWTRITPPMFHLCGHTEGAIDHLAGESQIIGRIAVMANGVHAAEGLYNFRHACQNICELAATLDRLAAWVVRQPARAWRWGYRCLHDVGPRSGTAAISNHQLFSI
jgi:hypothetical protein